MSNPSISDTLKELNELCHFFMNAEDALREGKATDLTGIETRVSAVCKTVQSAVPVQQKEYLPLLTTLIDLLNGYEKSLQEIHVETTPSIKQADHA